MATIYDELDLPPRLLAKRKLSAIEDVLLRILRPELQPEIPVYSSIPIEPPFPFVLVRRLSSMGDWGGDPRGLMDKARVSVHVYTSDPDGDMKGAVLGEVLRNILREAVEEHWSDAELGWYLHSIEMTSEPTRMSDWATSSGPVQYADLPAGTWRYEAHYRVIVRPLSS